MTLTVVNLTGTNSVVNLAGADWVFPPGSVAIETAATNGFLVVSGTTNEFGLTSQWGSQLKFGPDGYEVTSGWSLLTAFFAGFGVIVTLGLITFGAKMLRFTAGYKMPVPEL